MTQCAGGDPVWPFLHVTFARRDTHTLYEVILCMRDKNSAENQLTEIIISQ